MKPNPKPILDAFARASARGLLPTTLDSRGLREMGADVLRNSVFCAHGASVVFVSRIKEVVDAVAAGDMDYATARLILIETLRALNYTPEGGFPDTPPGAVPPALAGTLQDLSSRRRIELILKTQLQLARGAGQQYRGHARAAQFPAWELIRVYQVKSPRKWGGLHDGTPPRRKRIVDPRPRWTIAGGRLKDGRMIALKGDPIWGELGSYENFDDALGVDHPPFAFNSGMGWREIAAGEVMKLGITGPDGETPAAWQASTPATLAGRLPAPQLDVNRVDPELLRKLKERDGVVVVDGTATTPENERQLRDKIEARRKAREERRSSRLDKSIADRREEYANR